MRVLIINSNQARTPWPVPPVGACAIASSAAEAGHDVRFLDLCFARNPEAAIAKVVHVYRPQVAGVSIRNIDDCDWQANHFYLPDIRARIIRPLQRAAHCPVIVGGAAAGIMPAELLQYLGVDFVIRGDGELAIVGLLRVLEKGGALAEVPGLVYQDGQGVHDNEPARALDLDGLPMAHPQRWIDLRRYASYSGALGIQTKRGCALRCTYCAYNRIEGACYRLKSPQRVAREVQEAVTEGGVHAIEFVDSTFNIPLAHALDICRTLVERKFDARFLTMGINPGAVTEELFRLLRQANFSEVSITPETASPAMLASLGKNFSVQDIGQAAAIARRSRLPVMWYFMFGGPGETEDTVRETLAFIHANIPPSHLVLLVSGVRILKGAPLAERARQEGQLDAQQSLLEPVFYRSPIDRHRLFRLLDEEMLRNPNHIAMQDEYVPAPLLRAASAIHRFFHSQRPLWQYLRHIRRLLNALGLPPHVLARG